METIRKPYMVGLVLIICLGLLEAEGRSHLGIIPGLMNPRMMEIGMEMIYISDQHSVSIFALDSLDLIKRLGRPGEGPGELSVERPWFALNGANLYIFDQAKILVFNDNFELVEELRFPFNLHQEIIPVLTDGFVFNRESFRAGQELFEYFIVSRDGLKQKVFLKVKLPERLQTDLITPWPRIRSWRDRIYFHRPAEDLLLIEVYSQEGKQLNTIAYDPGQVKAGEIHRRLEIEDLREYLGKQRYNRFNARNPFESKKMPKYLPHLLDFMVRDNHIFIRTFEVKGDRDKYLVFDLEGKFRYQTFLPRVNRYGKRFTFHEGHFYYLIDDGEAFSLYRESLARKNQGKQFESVIMSFSGGRCRKW